MADNDLAVTIGLTVAVIIASFALGLFLVHVLPTEQNCKWISDKGIVFENEEQVQDMILAIEPDKDLMNNQYDNMYYYGFIKDNITYTDMIWKVC